MIYSKRLYKLNCNLHIMNVIHKIKNVLKKKCFHFLTKMRARFLFLLLMSKRSRNRCSIGEGLISKCGTSSLQDPQSNFQSAGPLPPLQLMGRWGREVTLERVKTQETFVRLECFPVRSNSTTTQILHILQRSV